MNPYQKSLETFFQKITNLEYALFFLDNTLNRAYLQTSKRVLESKGDDKTIFGMLSRQVISDITGPTDNGWELNHSTGFRKVIFFDTLRSDIDSLLNRESCFTIAQAHETFESFLKTVLAIAIFSNQFKSDLKELKFVNIDSFENCNDFINHKIPSGTNNKTYFKILREVCPTYIKFEEENNLGINLYDYYFVVAEIRHALIHSELIIRSNRLKKLSTKQLHILENLRITTQSQTGQELIIRKIDAGTIIKRLVEVAFTIFKSLSIQYGFKWQILK